MQENECVKSYSLQIPSSLKSYAIIWNVRYIHIHMCIYFLECSEKFNFPFPKSQP